MKGEEGQKVCVLRERAVRMGHAAEPFAGKGVGFIPNDKHESHDMLHRRLPGGLTAWRKALCAP